jgi:hypothetical protein
VPLFAFNNQVAVVVQPVTQVGLNIAVLSPGATQALVQGAINGANINFQW